MSEKYVDSFVMPVSKSKLEDYKKFAEKMAMLARKHGALEYVNCIADDVKPGSETSFPQSVKLGEDEVVVMSWAVYKSREDRDRANKAIMADDGFKELSQNLPVDGKRMFTGGFAVLRGM
ncbi:MAG: DUF1428 domain-containing protein [Bradyrhizobium sp.]|nr:MAG: DUF1428 domain-containing protein [Bradyrhizobium sp.]